MLTPLSRQPPLCRAANLLSSLPFFDTAVIFFDHLIAYPNVQIQLRGRSVHVFKRTAARVFSEPEALFRIPPERVNF